MHGTHTQVIQVQSCKQAGQQLNCTDTGGWPEPIQPGVRPHQCLPGGLAWCCSPQASPPAAQKGGLCHPPGHPPLWLPDCCRRKMLEALLEQRWGWEGPAPRPPSPGAQEGAVLAASSRLRQHAITKQAQRTIKFGHEAFTQARVSIPRAAIPAA